MTAMTIATETRSPIWVWLDPTRRCNLECSLCYTKHSHEQSDMSPETFTRILQKLESGRSAIRVVHLNWRGEPLMNAQFEELLHLYFERWGDVPMHWHSNGTLMTRRRAEQIVAVSKPHTIFVSIDGGTEDSHERNRGRGSFRRALKGLKNLLEANGDSGPLKVGVYQIDLGVPVDMYDPEFRDLASCAHEWVKMAPVEHDGSEAGSTGPVDGPCFWAGHAVCVDPSGKVSICLLSKGDYGVIGNLLEEPLERVLERARAWRAVLGAEGRKGKLQCRLCRKKSGNAYDDVLDSATR